MTSSGENATHARPRVQPPLVSFAALADAMPGIVWTAPARGAADYANKAWYTFTGLPHEKPVAEGYAEALHPDDKERVATTWARAQETGIPYEIELRLRSASGAYHWFLVRGTPLRDDAGDIVHWVGVSLDITERKQAEDALRNSDERHQFFVRLHDVLRPLTDPIAIQFEAARILGEHVDADRVGYAEGQGDGEHLVITRHYVNGVPGVEGRYRYGDYAPGVLRALRVGETVVRTDIPNDPHLTDAEKKTHAALAVGATVNVPLLKDGRLVAVMFMHARTARAWTAQEVTLLERVATRTWEAVERARAEAALRHSEERFRILADTAPSMIWTAATDGTITYANRRWLEYVGLETRDEGARWPELPLHPDDRERCVTAWREHLSSGEDYTIEVRHRRYDGLYRWFLTRATPVKDAAGIVTGWFGVTTDIHDQKLLEQHLRDADQTKNEFLAMLAHELRNPLAPIRTSAALLQQRGLSEPVLVRCRDVIDRQAAHMARLLDDLLDVSRLSRGTISLQRAPVALSTVLAAAIEGVTHLLEGNRQRLVTQGLDAHVMLDADLTRLTQVIGNVLNNAVKFTDPGGEIRLTVKSEAARAVISVADDGPGIPPDRLDAVFDLFTQTNADRDRAKGGLGIGLSLARRLVTMHGGTLHAFSEGIGRGSVFTVTLPTIPLAPEAASSHVEAVASSGFINKRVLVADDHPDGAEMLAVLLEQVGCQVQAVHSGAAALAAFAAFRPEIVLLDIGMPDMDGYETCRRLREMPGGSDVAILALTGWGQEQDRQRGADAGFNRHLVKPFDPEKLLSVLREVSPARQQEVGGR